MICQSILFRQGLWEWPFPQWLWEWYIDSSCSQNGNWNADFTPSLYTLAVLPIKYFVIISITFRWRLWELIKIYKIAGGVVEGVENIRVISLYCGSPQLLQINYFSLTIWKWAKALKALIHPFNTLSKFVNINLKSISQENYGLQICHLTL